MSCVAVETNAFLISFHIMSLVAEAEIPTPQALPKKSATIQQHGAIPKCAMNSM